jgi:ABC-type phosphate transport system substrate-binding protein
VLKKNASQLKAYWAQQVFTGGGKPPPELEGDDAVLKHVADTPGGIGYVESGKTRAGVRVIKR